VCDLLRSDVDEVVSLLTPDSFVAVGFWYRDFSQTSTNEVVRLLQEAQRSNDS
jgi:putative phosphoribosyl transferase